MTDPAKGLLALVEHPPVRPTPVEHLHRRVAVRRRHRRALRAALAGVAVAVAGVVVVPLVDRPSDVSTQVVANIGQEGPQPGMTEVAQAPANGSTLVLVADQECAALRWVDGDSALGGGCATRPTGHFVEAIGKPVEVGGNLIAAILCGGPSMARYSTRLDDGRTVDGSLGAGGWALVVSDGTVVGVSGLDAQGRGVPEWIVR